MACLYEPVTSPDSAYQPAFPATVRSVSLTSADSCRLPAGRHPRAGAMASGCVRFLGTVAVHRNWDLNSEGPSFTTRSRHGANELEPPVPGLTGLKALLPTKRPERCYASGRGDERNGQASCGGRSYFYDASI